MKNFKDIRIKKSTKETIKLWIVIILFIALNMIFL